MKRVFFTLASARSGTLYLRGLFARNVGGCAARHETFFDWGNPSMFGPAIYDAYAGRTGRIRARLAKKRSYVERLPQDIYLESSHSFLKSSYIAALEYFPEMQLIHLVRDPLKVARSEAYRQEWRQRLHVPFHFYKGDDGRRHFCWALTGNEEIFQSFQDCRLSTFQWYLIQWIEIENRAIRFLDEHRLRGRCFTLHSPRDLNDRVRLREMFDFFKLPIVSQEVATGGRRNQSIGYKAGINALEEQECQEVVARLPSGYLEIFRREPYAGLPWNARFVQAGVPRPELQGM